MEYIKALNEKILWGIPMMTLILLVGVYLLITTRAAVFVHFGFMLRSTIGSLFKKRNNSGGITSFAAVSTALAATVGTGNIVGVALAVRLGGPGAVFWMWVSGMVGMAVKYAEVILAVKYRQKTESGYIGGPMYYMRDGLSVKILPYVFCFFAVFSSFGIGNTVQANAFANGVNVIFGLSPSISGVILAVCCFAILSGGIKRISDVSKILVPIMAVLYMLACAIILIKYFYKIPQCFTLIIKSAFAPCASAGGFAGASVAYAARIGISRGLFTNEAGLGSASIAHASANVKNPVSQGMWGVFEVFFDTIIMCSMTALVILLSGVWKSDCGSAYLAQKAFSENIPCGGYIVSLGLTMFAFASIIAWYYYGESCVGYLLGKKGVALYKTVYIFACYFGCVCEITFVWEAADTLNAFMMLPNLCALIFLGKEAGNISNDFFGKNRKV